MASVSVLQWAHFCTYMRRLNAFLWCFVRIVFILLKHMLHKMFFCLKTDQTTKIRVKNINVIMRIHWRNEFLYIFFPFFFVLVEFIYGRMTMPNCFTQILLDFFFFVLYKTLLIFSHPQSVVIVRKRKRKKKTWITRMDDPIAPPANIWFFFVYFS